MAIRLLENSVRKRRCWRVIRVHDSRPPARTRAFDGVRQVCFPAILTNSLWREGGARRRVATRWWHSSAMPALEQVHRAHPPASRRRARAIWAEDKPSSLKMGMTAVGKYLRPPAQAQEYCTRSIS